MKKYKISIILCFLVVFATLFTPTASAYTPPPEVEVHAGSVYMVNLETNTVVYQKNATASIYPASVTKLMTALVALEQTPDLTKTITVYDDVVDDLWNTGAATAWLKPDEQVTMEQLLNLLLIPSACDAANVIAIEVSGSVDGFVALMNQKAAQLGMKNTVYVNPHGLHDDRQVTTAYDLYLLAKEIIQHPELTKICSTVTYTLPKTNMSDERTYTTTNYMINPSSSWYYKRVQGLKTGYTDAAGRNLVSLAEKDGQRYLSVVMNCPAEKLNGYDVHKEFDTTYDLLYWAFTELEYKNVINTTQPVEEIKVTLCDETDYVKLVPEKEFFAMVPKQSQDNVILVPHVTATTLEAPIEKGAVLGTATVMCAGEEIGTVNLVAQTACERDTGSYLWDRTKKGVMAVLSSPWFYVPVLLLLSAIIVLVVWNVRVNQRRRRLWQSKVRKNNDDR